MKFMVERTPLEALVSSSWALVESKRSRRSLLGALVLLSTLNYQPATLLAQGSLTPPPGAPTPMMKSLDQVEARKIINATNTPGDASNSFIISQPGSYYLTGNFTGSGGKTAISIQSDNVTVDLNGFIMFGFGGSVPAINVPGNAGIHKNICIRNGTIRNWGNGGVRADNARGSLLENLRASDNTSNGSTGAAGLLAGESCVVKNCTATTNNGIDGIHAGTGSSVLDCVAWGNSGAGFFLDDGVTASRCTAKGNLGTGFHANDYCTIAHCTAMGNQGAGINVNFSDNVIDCDASANGNDGILAQQGSTVRGCNCSVNGWSGIEVTDSCHVIGNACDNNNFSMSTFSGINASGHGNHIQGNSSTNTGHSAPGITVGSLSVVEGNNLDNNVNGIVVSGNGNKFDSNRVSCSTGQAFIINGSNNLIIRNSARAISMVNQFSIIGANNSYGTTVDTSAGGQLPASVRSDPWSNITY